MKVPAIRARRLRDGRPNPDGSYVLYWMTANRRVTWNFALQRAAEWCRRLGRPLLILEALRASYPWSSARLHRFIIDGMLENQRALERRPAVYYPYLEEKAGDGKGLLERLSARACMVVGDDYPAFFLPSMQEAAANRLRVPFEVVDSNGVLPMRAAEKVYTRAYDFRRFLQKQFSQEFPTLPEADPLREMSGEAEVESGVLERWPRANLGSLDLSTFSFEAQVSPVSYAGGTRSARSCLERFLDERLSGYTERNRPDVNVSSGLSPYLHFGHISTHEVFSALCSREGWNPDKLGWEARGKRTGWWGVSEPAEAFVDQLITWRELGFNLCWQTDDFDQYDSLPDWARATLEEHRYDEREHLYELDQLEQARTHDEVWNAAQRQLVKEGRIHNYLRMLWGKKILKWTDSPQQALSVMIELNNKFAMDGRDPNSYSGIFWCLGRYDRPWPERKIFGKVRSMTSASTRRKFNLQAYLKTWRGK